MRFAHLSLFGICTLTLVLVIYITEILDKVDQIVTQYESDLNGRRSSIRTAPTKPGHCALPRLNPFDPSILEYVEVPVPGIKKLDCTEEAGRPILFSTDYESNLIRLDDPAKYGLLECCFKFFQLEDEEQISVSVSCYPITNDTTPIDPLYQFIIVYCTDNGLLGGWIPWTSKTFPVDMFNFVHERAAAYLSANRDPSTATTVNDSLNVVLIGLDGVSHMNFIRTMPLTHSYLRNVSAIEMDGYTKVGDNTFPNVIPLLAGLSAKEVEAKDGCWGGGRQNYFDKCPLVWKNFSRAGYVTSYAEDAQAIATFNYEKAGFKVPPTDYYLRPFLGLLGDQLGHVTTGNVDLCYGPRSGFKVGLDHVAKLAVTMARPSVDKKYFAFSWSNTISHDQLNTPNFGDKDLLQLLRWFESRSMEDTAIILLSDHGIRTGDIRTTIQGRIEERMPMLYFMFPKWFRVKYSTAILNLVSNAERLTTPFDLHETLLDLIDPAASISEESLQKHRHTNLSKNSTSKPAALPRGISLFVPVPEGRTCTDAGIEPHWCVCHSMHPVTNPGTDQRATNATKAILETLNAMLAKYPQCAQLHLASILNAQEISRPVLENLDEVSESEWKHTSPESFTTLTLTVTFKVTPSEGIFEATVVQDRHGKWMVSGDVDGDAGGDISRLNMYGNQSRCVDDYRLKKFCFCS